MSDLYNININQELPNNVTVEGGVANRITLSEEQENVIRIATLGLQGPPGTQIIDGAGPPSASIGRIGDFFIDTADRLLWGPKTAGGWGDSILFGGAQYLNEQGDVTLTPTIEDQSVLMWDDSVARWVNQRVRYRHSQGAPAAVWTISHGLRTKPSGVSVFDTSGGHVIGELTHVDDNNLTITFSSAFAGVAYLG